MIPLETALAIVDERLGNRRVPSETVALHEAAGRILAADQRSRLDLPPFDKAAVDGYAVDAGDVHQAYRLVGTVAAGQPGLGALAPGTTAKVMTGAPVPPGTERVIMVEQAVEREGLVRFEQPGAASNMCRKAEDVAAGQKIITAGSRLGVLEIANLTGCGITDVEVRRRPRLAIISTGDEIADSPADLCLGRIMNTNGPLLTGLARKFGLTVVSTETVRDDESKLVEAMQRALAAADLVVLSGGVSAGEYDFVPDAITACGLQIHFSRVAVKPGKPTVFATGEHRILFGLPGNPVAVYLTFHLYALRAVARLTGGSFEPLRFEIRLADNFNRRSGARMEYSPCRITADGLAESISYHGSAHLAALMRADGFIVIPQEVKALAAGTAVPFVMFGAEGP